MIFRDKQLNRFAVIVCLWAAAVCQAADWPRYGGPNCTGASLETNLAHAWAAEGPRVLWTVDVGEGYAGPAIRDGEVYLVDRVPDTQDMLRCLELASGRELWKVAWDAPGKYAENGSRSIPTVDEKFVFVAGPLGEFQCIDRKTHAIVWSKHLVNDFKDPAIDISQTPTNREDTLRRTQVPMWGITQAPLLYRDLVIVAPQTQKVGLVAYEKATGNIRWRSDYIGRNWYSHVSPYLATLCGVDQVIMLAQPSDPEKSPDDAPRSNITSIDPGTGAILWKTQSPKPHKIPIPQPVQIGEDRLFITGGYNMGSFILQASHTGEQWGVKLLTHNPKATPKLQSPVLYKGRIYLTCFKDQGGNQNGLVCLGLDGQPLWQTGVDLQFDSGSYLLADDLAFVMHGKTGMLYMLGLSDAGAKVLGSAKVLEAKHGNVWAPLALSDGKLIVRDQNQMKCLDVRNPGAPGR
jgi:outer membrane protein assembly factor BamB